MTVCETFRPAFPLFIERTEIGILQTVMQAGIKKICKKIYFTFTKYTYWKSGTKDTPIEKEINL